MPLSNAALKSIAKTMAPKPSGAGAALLHLATSGAAPAPAAPAHAPAPASASPTFAGMPARPSTTAQTLASSGNPAAEALGARMTSGTAPTTGPAPVLSATELLGAARGATEAPAEAAPKPFTMPGFYRRGTAETTEEPNRIIVSAAPDAEPEPAPIVATPPTLVDYAKAHAPLIAAGVGAVAVLLGALAYRNAKRAQSAPSARRNPSAKAARPRTEKRLLRDGVYDLIDEDTDADGPGPRQDELFAKLDEYARDPYRKRLVVEAAEYAYDRDPGFAHGIMLWARQKHSYPRHEFER